jgi:hypothetical protein
MSREFADISLQRALAAWGTPLPDWVEALATKSDSSSQNLAGKAVGYSGSVVNAVLAKTYKGDLEAVEKAVRGRFMKQTVACPVLGELASHICLQHQKMAVSFSMGSSFRVRMARACRGVCPNSRIGRPEL